MYRSEDYLFSNVKELREGLPGIGAAGGQKDQSFLQRMPSKKIVDAAKDQSADDVTDSHLDQQIDRSITEKNLSIISDDQLAEDQRQKAALHTAAGHGVDVQALAAKEAEERRLVRENYVKTIRMIMKGIIDILDILKKPPEKRSREQNLHLACFLSYKIEFFKTDEFFDAEFMHDVAEKVETRVYKQNDIIMRKGEVGDRLFISIKGQLGVYVNDSPEDLKKDPIALIKEFRVVGERSLKYPQERRNATVVCMDRNDTICITLTREDYKKLINVSAQFINL